MSNGIRLQAIKPRVGASVFQAVIKATAAAQQRAGRDLLADFEATTEGWRREVRWRVLVSKSSVTVSTDDEVWRYQDEGTRPHEIRARRARVLAFTNRSGDRVFARVVQHPGTRPKGYTTAIRAKWEKLWPERLQAAVHLAATKG